VVDDQNTHDDTDAADDQEAPDTTAHGPEGTAPTGADKTEPDMHTDDDPDEEADVGWWPEPDHTGRRVMSTRNAAVTGRLQLDYPSRRIELTVDGDTALRLIKRMEVGDSFGDLLTDRLHPTTSSAHASWMCLRPEEVLAASWIPGMPESSSPAAVVLDPPAA
jgi:hypothetical protein